MTDRELLEMAAKAAGIDLRWKLGVHQITLPPTLPYYLVGGLDQYWNPLTDDGDALRLAAKLMLNVLASAACIVAEDEDGVECFEYMYGPEDYTSGWRRAIVRAAAAIGSAM